MQPELSIPFHSPCEHGSSCNRIVLLPFSYDEFHLVPVLDENGNMMLRDEFYLEGLNCDPETFDLECELLNHEYNKNSTYDEIKSHHYIISHDPKDNTDHNLTGEWAQTIGMEYTKMAKARGDAKLTESKLRKTNEQIHYLGQYLSTKSIYGEFLKAPNKKIFRQAHSDELAQYEEALQILKQHSPDGKFPTMKDLRAEKEQLTIQKDAQYDTYRYFKDYHKELQTVCANVDSILGAEQKVQQHEQQHTRKYEPSL